MSQRRNKRRRPSAVSTRCLVFFLFFFFLSMKINKVQYYYSRLSLRTINAFHKASKSFEKAFFCPWSSNFPTNESPTITKFHRRHCLGAGLFFLLALYGHRYWLSPTYYFHLHSRCHCLGQPIFRHCFVWPEDLREWCKKSHQTDVMIINQSIN